MEDLDDKIQEVLPRLTGEQAVELIQFVHDNDYEGVRYILRQFEEQE